MERALEAPYQRRAVVEPMAQTVDVAAGAATPPHWTLLIVYHLADGPRRFSQLESATGMIPRVLAGRLRELENQGMLTRTQYPEIPPRVEYALTDKGTATLPTLEALRSFGARWLNDEESAALDSRRTRQPVGATA